MIRVRSNERASERASECMGGHVPVCAYMCIGVIVVVIIIYLFR